MPDTIPSSPFSAPAPGGRLSQMQRWFRMHPDTAGIAVDVAGIGTVTCSLLVYGLLQERIMTIGFGPKNADLFDSSVFLVLCNRLVTCLVAFTWVAATSQDVKPVAPLSSYSAVSFTNVVATSCQYEALRYVSFSVQTLAKSAKVLPVMLWGTVYTGKRYRASEYFHALTITAGCTIFVWGGDSSSRRMEDKTSVVSYAMGAGLMLLYLAVDGLTSTWQDSMFTNYSMSICDQVMYTTAFSTVLALIGSVTAGQLFQSLEFVLLHPDALWFILALSTSSAVVQLIISYTIKRYGAVVFATIMTTRQFASILLSSLVFQTPLVPLQWVGMLVVFGALFGRVAVRLKNTGITRTLSGPTKGLAASPSFDILKGGPENTSSPRHPKV